VLDTSDSCETNHSRKTRGVLLLIRRLATRVGAPGDETSVRGPCIAWRLAARYAPPGGDEKTVGVWEDAGAWREVNTARRSGAISPGGVWAGPGGNAVALAFGVLFC